MHPCPADDLSASAGRHILCRGYFTPQAPRRIGVLALMSDREPEPWETSVQAPFLTLERAGGVIEVWALGADCFSVRAPERDVLDREGRSRHEQLVAGFDAARAMAQTLA